MLQKEGLVNRPQQMGSTFNNANPLIFDLMRLYDRFPQEIISFKPRKALENTILQYKPFLLKAFGIYRFNYIFITQTKVCLATYRSQ
ncbi:MAG: hypothetical protein DID90_2727554807 [Candidatus Nitrotoga sp. LAW]|nr:MAG: hypothetical protein DID90_2727554807 [Candidatus Nitrotoga sp. LAW]